MALNKEDFLNIMREIPAVVVVVVAELPEGGWRGMTASSFTSVSLDPLLVSLNVMEGSQMHSILQNATRYTINILSADQCEISTHFAIPDMPNKEQWEGIDFKKIDAALVLDGGIGWFLCEQHARYITGDHTTFIGKVTDGSLGKGGEALLYYRHSYCPPGEAVEGG